MDRLKKILKRLDEALKKPVPAYVLLIAIIAGAAWAATAPTRNDHGSWRGNNWTDTTINSTSTDITDGKTVDVGGLDHLTYWVYIAQGATCTPQFQATGSDNWIDGNAITATGIYSDPRLYGADLFRVKVEDSSGTVEWVTGAGIDVGRVP